MRLIIDSMMRSPVYQNETNPVRKRALLEAMVQQWRSKRQQQEDDRQRRQGGVDNDALAKVMNDAPVQGVC